MPNVEKVQPACAVNLRIKAEVRDTIDAAARMLGKSRSEFMIEAARRAAEDAILDRTLLRIDEKTYGHFLAVLDAPPVSEGYKRLMRASVPWTRRREP